MLLLLATAFASGRGVPAEPPLVEPAPPIETLGQRVAPADVARPPADARLYPGEPPLYATVTNSGLTYVVLEKGPGGRSPVPDDTVVTHYTGWTADGEVLDSSYTRGKPARFPLRGVILGWTEGLQQMQTGDVYRFWIPPELAYGDGPGPRHGRLTFDVSLIEIED